MYGVIDRISGSAGDDRQERLQYDLNVAFARERNTVLGELYRYWLSRRQPNGDLPREWDFHPKRDLLTRAGARVTCVDTRFDDPLHFRFFNHGALTFWDFSGRQLMDYPCRLHALACAREYMLCRWLRMPMYHEIDQEIGGWSRRYRRLLLPVADETDLVSKLYYAVTIISFRKTDSALPTEDV